MTDHDRDRLTEQLILHEGLRLRPYTDTTGHLTIGVGRNLSGNGVAYGEAMLLLSNDIHQATFDCARLFFDVWDRLDAMRQRVLIDMCFNLGAGKLATFVRFLGRVRALDYEGAAVAMLESAWAGQVGARAQRLAAMMRTGQDYS